MNLKPPSTFALNRFASILAPSSVRGARMPQDAVHVVAPNVEAISVRELCHPRPSVFERGRADTVANIADFNAGKITADAFFAETTSQRV